MLSCIQLFVTLWNVAHQVPCSWDSPGKNTGVGCHFLLQGIFPTQGSSLGLSHFRQILYHLSHQGSPGGQGNMAESSNPLITWLIPLVTSSHPLKMTSLA